MKNKALFICGFENQTKMMHNISKHLLEFECYFTPYYDDGFWGWLGKNGFLESTLLSNKLKRNTENYLIKNCLNIDSENNNNDYDLIFTCSDQLVPTNVSSGKLILINQFRTKDKNLLFYFSKYFGFLRLFAGNSTIGLSNLYNLCFVPFESEKKRLISEGINSDKIIVTDKQNDEMNFECLDNYSEKFIAEKLNEYFNSFLRKYNNLLLTFTCGYFRNYLKVS